MTDLIQLEKIITARELVEKERKRLLDAPLEKDFFEWLHGRTYPLNWMKIQYGNTLKEKDGLHYANGERFDETDCNVCGRKVKPDEKVIRFEFSFCDEHNCEMNICRRCIKRLEKSLRLKDGGKA